MLNNLDGKILSCLSRIMAHPYRYSKSSSKIGIFLAEICDEDFTERVLSVKFISSTFRLMHSETVIA